MMHSLHIQHIIKTFLALIVFFHVSVFAQPVIQWDKTIGSPLNTAGNFAIMEQTTDGGYILAQTSNSSKAGDKSQNSRGNSDYWILKLAADGSIVWDQTLGGPGADYIASIHQTSDGGYIVGGTSNSPIGSEKSEKSRGSSDYWVVKLDQNGNKEWDKTIGGTSGDGLVDAQQTPDGGYIIVGSSGSGIGGDKTEPELGADYYYQNDFWVVKLSATGSIEWDRTHGTTGPDQLRCMTITMDGGIVLAGDQGFQEMSSGYYLIKISASGTKEWERTVGGKKYDDGWINGYAEIHDIEQTPDGGFILGGHSYQPAGGDQSEDSYTDYWIVKLNADLTIAWDNVLNTLFYNDGRGPNYFAGLAQTQDGGYVLLGYSSEPGLGDKSEDSHNESSDYWIVKLNASGTKVWDKVIGGSGHETASSIFTTSDGGLMLVGSSSSNVSFEKTENRKGTSDIWLVKLASEEPPLPVTLTKFSVQKESTTALLTWQTTSETRSKYFEIQHSTNGKLWNALGKENAKAESNKIANYQYIHESPASGDNLYRLKMVDDDGTFAFSKVSSLQFKEDFSICIYPNPAVESITVQVADWSKVKRVQVLNSFGTLVYQSGTKPVPGISARELSKGLYFVKISLNDGSVMTQKIAVVH